MNTSEVISKFINHNSGHTPKRNAPLNGIWAWYGSSLSSPTGETLMSYETMIAKWRGDKIAITDEKYSSTTSRQVSQLRLQCSRAGIETESL